MAEKVTIEKILSEKAPGANGQGPRETPRDGSPRRRGPRPVATATRCQSLRL